MEVEVEVEVKMESRKIVVIVEDIDISRAALKWALHNFVRYGDGLTLLHIFQTSRSRNKKKLRNLRLKGFQLALSFRDICNTFPNTKTEIVVTEGDGDGRKIAAMIREIGASTLVVGLHDQSFLYRLAMAQGNISSNLNCRVLAVKQPRPLMTKTDIIPDGSINIDFSQIDIAGLSVPHIPPPKIPYRICPDPSAILWRRLRRKRRNEIS